MNTLRQCPCCRGTGRIELTGAYADTLALLERQRQPLNAAALARLASVKPNAMANRLVALEKMGLAAGKRNGRERLWTAVKHCPLPRPDKEERFKTVFTHCNVCGIPLRSRDEDEMGMCEECADE